MAKQKTGHETQKLVSLRDWLNSLKWDGMGRIHNWTDTYLGTQTEATQRAAARAWLVSAVARAMQPGCLADIVLVLEGPQGCGKSTAIAALAGDDDDFGELYGELGSKEAVESLQGKWIVEIEDELGGPDCSLSVGDAKLFLTAKVDKYRPPYSKETMSVPRSCVFVTTTCPPLLVPKFRELGCVCKDIDVEAIRRDREQIWAEAVYCYNHSERWWLQ
jgi:predicted P-loop ATPase